MSEEEKRLHRCCFTGHRPEKLKEPEEEIKVWLEKQINRAIEDGFTTFISGCAMGVDLWAARIVTCRKMVLSKSASDRCYALAGLCRALEG